ncbi:MAG TPA: prolyl oligopeptidase family serine peptidase [Bryobacteraceae bacterium]|nr:prolyl oligopeptidase family serine peptidase [Bryobacteraceae bacterium]
MTPIFQSLVGQALCLRRALSPPSFACALLVLTATAASIPPPPPTAVHDVTETIHGHTITDPYRWLEDQNSPATRAWIDAQMKYTATILERIPGQAQLQAEVERYMRTDTTSALSEHGGNYYFVRRRPDQDQGVLYVRTGRDGPDKVIVDPLQLAPDHSMSVDLTAVSWDGRLAAYQLRHGGEDETTLSIYDAQTGDTLPDAMPKRFYTSAALKPDHTGIYYSFLRDGETPRVAYHSFGTSPSADVELFGKDLSSSDEVACMLSDTGRYLLIEVAHGSAADKTDVWYQDLAAKGPMLPLITGIAAKFSPVTVGDTVYLHSTWNAPKGRVLRVDMSHPSRDHWTEVVPERPYPLNGIAPSGEGLALDYVENAASRLELVDGDGRNARRVPLPAIGTIRYLNGRWQSKEVFIAFTSFTYPPVMFDYNAATGSQKEWSDAKSPIDASRFEVKQVWFNSKDGTRVPMFVVYQRGLKLDGSAPALLTGYGGFLLSMTPYYTSIAATWVAHGGVFALANLRGGGEFGDAWHQAGMGANKQNVFDDFIAATEYLIAKKYTSAKRMAIEGTSNGGLLVGAALTQRPDLYRAVYCGAPLLDMIRYPMFKIAKLWVPEYGSPDDPKQFEVLYRYSPYHHVKPGTPYPAIMLQSGDADTRVDPLHARKMTALLQADSSSGLPVVLLYDTQAGHAAALPVGRQAEKNAEMLAFLLHEVGAL